MYMSLLVLSFIIGGVNRNPALVRYELLTAWNPTQPGTHSLCCVPLAHTLPNLVCFTSGS